MGEVGGLERPVLVSNKRKSVYDSEIKLIIRAVKRTCHILKMRSRTISTAVVHFCKIILLYTRSRTLSTAVVHLCKIILLYTTSI